MAFPELSVPFLTLSQILGRLLGAVLVVSIYGATVSWLAVRLGDPGPAYDGRRTVNPLVHLDLIGLLHAVFFRLVWIRPIAVDPKLLPGWLGRIALVLTPSLVLAFLSAAALGARRTVFTSLDDSASFLATNLLSSFADIALVTSVANLLPIPPFLGTILLPLRAGAAPVATGKLYWATCTFVVLLSLTGVLPRAASVLITHWRSLLGW